MTEIIIEKIIPEMNKMVKILEDENLTDYSLQDNRSGWSLILTKKKEITEVINQ